MGGFCLLIKECKGYELEKEKPNTSEDFFNRSEVTFEENGELKTLHILYLRYFDEQFQTYTPFETDPVFTIGTRDVYFKDLVGIVCLLKNTGFRNRKRIYISSEKEFASYFEGVDFEKLKVIFTSLEQNGSYKLQSALEFLV